MNEVDTTGKPVDWNLFGRDETNAHRRLDIIFKPCTPIQQTPQNKNKADKECIVDLKDPAAVKRKFKDTIKYLGEPDLVLYENREYIDLQSYGSNTVKKASKIYNR